MNPERFLAWVNRNQGVSIVGTLASLVGLGVFSTVNEAGAFVCGILFAVGCIAIAVERTKREPVTWDSYDALYRLSGARGARAVIVERSVVRAQQDVEQFLYCLELFEGARSSSRFTCRYLDDEDSLAKSVTPERPSRKAGETKQEVRLKLPRTLLKGRRLLIEEISEHAGAFADDEEWAGKQLLDHCRRVRLTLVFEGCAVAQASGVRLIGGAASNRKPSA